MGCCNRKTGLICLFSFGIALGLLGLLVACFWSTLFDNLVQKELVLTNTSRSYDLWKETPIPMYFSIYMFNWTNSDEVLKSKWKIKPKLQECGPYVFSEHHIRVNLTWNSNGTVTYHQKRVWHFIPNMSKGNLTDKITNLNPVVAVIGKRAKSWDKYSRMFANLLLRGFEHSIVITKTVDELLFTGYNDTVLSFLKFLKINLPFDKFGWFYGRNNSETYDGSFTIYTGKTGVDLIGVMDLWNGEATTPDYSGYCGYVNGTSGELWPPTGDYQKLSIFSSDLCSSIPISYANDEEVHDLTGRKYIATDVAFDNGTKYPEQKCFFKDKTPSGVRDISSCRFGVPIFISYPHFYLADPSYRDAVDGMHPNETLHQMYITLEPITGIPLDARAQMQVNLHIEYISDMSMFENVASTYMPMVWFKQSATLTSELADTVQVIVGLQHMGAYAGWSVFAVGIVLTFAGIYVVFRKEKDNEEEQLLDHQEAAE